MNPPCKDCPNRHPGCHGSCEKYQTWRKEWEQLKERESDSARVCTDLRRIPILSYTALKDISNGSCNHP